MYTQDAKKSIVNQAKYLISPIIKRLGLELKAKTWIFESVRIFFFCICIFKSEEERVTL